MPIGYHFTGNTLRDGRPLPAIGEKLVHEGEIVICSSGLHWCECPFDALYYAPGALLHRVECSEPVASEDDKHVSRERAILATIDAMHLLRRFAADQALSVAHLWDMPEITRDYFTTLDESKRDAAWAAAIAAAWVAASDAARAAAWAAAWAAARDDASAAARAAAWNMASAAEWDTANAAAWTAAWDAARKDFRARVEAAFS